MVLREEGSVDTNSDSASAWEDDDGVLLAKTLARNLIQVKGLL